MTGDAPVIGVTPKKVKSVSTSSHSELDHESGRPAPATPTKASKPKSRSKTNRSSSVTRQSKRKGRSEVTPAQSLSETNFAKTFKKIDATAEGLIAEAVKASKNDRRAAARIVVEGVRLFVASESATNEWAELTQREFTARKIKVNLGENYAFRVVANLIFRGVHKNKNATDLADSEISKGQIARYAQAMAWAYAKHKSGSDLKRLADAIVKLGGVRKVADLWSNAQRSLEEKAASTADAKLPSEVSEVPEQTELPVGRPERAGLSLPIIGVAKLKKAITSPMVCVTYPDGKVYRAPLSPEKMTSWVAKWERGQ